MAYNYNPFIKNFDFHDKYASKILTDTSNFDKKLSSSDVNIQLALDTLDDHTHPYAQVVSVAKSGGMFMTWTEALASITDASSIKKYCILGYPGVYDEQITSKDYVDLIGIGPPRSVVISSSLGTVLTLPNPGRSDIRNITLSHSSTINGSSCVVISAGTHLFYDTVVEQAASNSSGILIDVSGTGTLQLNTGQLTLVQTGVSAGVGNDNCLVKTSGTTLLYLRGINGTLILSDPNDNACGFREESTSTGSVSWQDCFIDVNITASSYTGIATSYALRAPSIDKYFMSSRIKVRNTSGSVGGSGFSYIVSSPSGGAYLKSSHNIVDVSGFSKNHYANVDFGDKIISEFDSIDAPDGCIGLGDVDNEDGVRVYHGVFDRSTAAGLNCLPTHITSTTFTVGALANPITYYYRGIECRVSADISATLDDGAGGSTTGIYWVYFYRATGTILATKIPPGFSNTSNVIIATVIWNGSNYGLVNDERHGYNRNQSWHESAHATIGTRYKSGFDFVPTGTGATATFTMSGGEIWDEDLSFSAVASSSYPTPHAIRTFYQTGAATYAFDATTSTIPFKAGPNFRPMFVDPTGYVLTEADHAPTKYHNFFIYGTTDLHTPIYCFVETVSGGYSTVALARAARFPNLSGSSLSAELKPLYRLVVRSNGEVEPLLSEDDYRLVTSLPMSAGFTATVASAVTFIPAGNISSSNVQLAIEELDLEKENALTISTGLTRVVDTITSDLSTGIVGGQAIYGGVNASDDLTISSTAHGTKGNLFFGTSTYDEVGNNFGVNTIWFGTGAVGVLGIGNGTEPSTNPTDMIQVYSKDSSDGTTNSTLAIKTEQAVEAIGTFTASHKLKIWINGVEYWIQLDAV